MLRQAFCHPAATPVPQAPLTSHPDPVAAMEPADDRREHLSVRLQGGASPDHAAMEPADDRREHTFAYWHWPGTSWPQWSPPMIGGSTIKGRGDRITLFMPQWSPPMIGGSTRMDSRRDAALREAAMEPADDRREHSAGRPWSSRTWRCRNGARRLSAGALADNGF